MTYPPQQPGQPGPYGQDPYGNQGQWGQQPGGFPQSGPQPQPGYPGGYPQSGPQPQPGYPGAGQQDQWGQQQPGQPNPWAQQGQGNPWDQQQAQGNPWGQQPGGYSPYPDPGGQPPKKKTGLIIGIVVAVVLLVGGGVTAIVLLTGKSGQNSSAAGSSTPEGLMQAVIKGYGDKNAQEFVPLICQPPSQTQLQTLQSTLDKIPAGVTYTEASAPTISGSTGTLNLRVSAPSGQHQDFPLGISKSGGNWCVTSAD
jgi:hypothetical protein